jgi:hypothetical protein
MLVPLLRLDLQHPKLLLPTVIGLYPQAVRSILSSFDRYVVFRLDLSVMDQFFATVVQRTGVEIVELEEVA